MATATGLVSTYGLTATMSLIAMATATGSPLFNTRSSYIEYGSASTINRFSTSISNGSCESKWTISSCSKMGRQENLSRWRVSNDLWTLICHGIYSLIPRPSAKPKLQPEQQVSPFKSKWTMCSCPSQNKYRESASIGVVSQ